jgi:hypothetical protein
MPVVKLTPAVLKRMVLEEKKKIEKQVEMDKAALKAMEMRMEEVDDDFASGSVVKNAKKSSDKSFQGHGAGDVEGYKTLKKLEESLERRLSVVREQREALRRRILSRR